MAGGARNRQRCCAELSSARSRSCRRRSRQRKIAGVRAYEKARKNEPVDLKPVEVTVQNWSCSNRHLALRPRDLRPSDLRPRVRRPHPAPPPRRLQRRLLRPLARARHRAACWAAGRTWRRCGGRARDGSVVDDARDARGHRGGGAASADRLVPLRALLRGHAGRDADGRGPAAGRARQYAWRRHHVAGPVRGGPARTVRVPPGRRRWGCSRSPNARADGLLHPLVVLR